MAEVVAWSHEVPEGAWVESRVVTGQDGSKVLSVTALEGASEFYVDVPLTIAGHAEVYRVRGRVVAGSEQLEFVSVEELG